MEKILIAKRQETAVQVTDKGSNLIAASLKEKLSGPPPPPEIPSWKIPSQVLFNDGGTPRVSPIFKVQTNVVNNQQVDQFFLYGAAGGFRWVNASLCVPSLTGFPPGGEK